MTLRITDASRFLARSQSQLSFTQDLSDSRGPAEPQRSDRARTPARAYLQRHGVVDTFRGPSHPSRLPFASRFSTSTTSAPLFYSATDDFREEDDGREHEREVADLYALQRSRRDFAIGRRSESSTDEERGSRRGEHGAKYTPHKARGGGIKSSWTEDEPDSNDLPSSLSQTSATPSEAGPSALMEGTAAHLVDVDLASTIRNNPSQSKHDHMTPDAEFYGRTRYQQKERAHPARFERARDSNSEDESVASGPQDPVSVPVIYDGFWSSMYLICLASLFATFILIWLHTSTPARKGLLGDTIYTTMHASFHLLAIDTLVAIIVALFWLAALRSFVRSLVMSVLVAVPVVLACFSLYPFISSFYGSWQGRSTQDKVMRWLALLPAVVAIFWTYTVYKGRHSLKRAIEILEFATRILASSPALILAGFVALTAVVVWTWLWMLMFTRVFLGGHLSGSGSVFIINTSTWWLGIFFVLIYLWTLGVIAGLQRTTTAATVSQWYFHRLTTPAPSSYRVVHASVLHAFTTILGTICAATLLSLIIRLPLLVLPRRISGFVMLCLYSVVPVPIANLTNPLTLTYAAIHSQCLSTSARGLSEMPFLSKNSPTTTLTPGTFSQPGRRDGSPPLLAYRLAKLLLHATRFITSLAFGFGGWVSTARMLQGSDSIRGSLYAYVVGLIAAAIGWAVLGAMEGVMGGILDAVVVCWGSEVGATGLGQAKYCREAGELFKDEAVIEL